MVLVYLNSGECIEVTNAFSAERRSDLLVCLDRDGHLTASFAASTVESFTSNEEMAEAIKEEVCEDLTIIESDQAVEEPDPA